jgi:hypothetical protein
MIYREIMSGGPIANRSRYNGKNLSSSDLEKIGQWLDVRLKKRDIWIVLMPPEMFDSNYLKGLETHPDWRYVFYTDKQRMLIDIQSDKGKEFYKKILAGEAVYPDDLIRDTTLARTYLLYGQNIEKRKEGLALLMEIFSKKASQAVLTNIINYGSENQELLPVISNFCLNYFNAFNQNRPEWSKTYDYHERLESARLSAYFLYRISTIQKDKEKQTFYKTKIDEFVAERNRLLGLYKW